MYLRRFEKSNWIKYSEVAGLAMDMFARFTTRFRLLSRDGAIPPLIHPSGKSIITPAHLGSASRRTRGRGN